MKPAATVIMLIGIVHLAASSQQHPGDQPLFSSHSTFVYSGKSATSPDGRHTVEVRVVDKDIENSPSEVTVRTPTRTFRARIDFGLNAEVLWSDDSTSFSITGSSGGGLGYYKTEAFRIGDTQLLRTRLTPIVRKAFGHPVKCASPEYPNVAAIKWAQGSRKIIVAAQVLGHTNCDSMGTFKAYEIDLRSARITEIYDQLEAKQNFASDLGALLKGADDECIVNPHSCFVSTNHPHSKKAE